MRRQVACPVIVVAVGPRVGMNAPHHAPEPVVNVGPVISLLRTNGMVSRNSYRHVFPMSGCISVAVYSGSGRVQKPRMGIP